MYVVAITLIAIFGDVAMYGFQSVTTAKVATTVSKVIAVQGGVLSKPPDGYPGGKDAYYTPKQLQALIQKNLSKSGVKDGDWKVEVDGKTLITSSSCQTIKKDWMEEMNIELKTRYHWPILSKVLKSQWDTTINASRPKLSEWKYNYDEWLGE